MTDIESAIALLTEAVSATPSFDNFKSLSMAHLFKGNLDSGIHYLWLAAEIGKGSREALIEICNTLEQLPMLPPVTSCLRKIAALHHDNLNFMRLIERTALLIEQNSSMSQPARAENIARKLHSVGRKHGTDKAMGADAHTYGGLSYMDIYEPYLAPFREKPVNFLEIGVNVGYSHKAWEEYFPQGQIFGLDVNPISKQCEGGRIRITIGSQADPEVLTKLSAQVDWFDVVLDDGSHASEHMQKSFEYLWPRVRPGGLYIIEDLGCTYSDPDMNWSGMRYNKEAQVRSNREEFQNFFLAMIKDVDEERGDVLSVQFWHYIMVVLKKRKSFILSQPG